MDTKYRGKDDSLTHRHVKCLFKLFKFFGQELICPQMTNVKALALASSGIMLCAIIPYSDGLHLPAHILNTSVVCVRTISWLTLFLDSFKLFSRIRFHYSVYFYDKCYHCPTYFFARAGDDDDGDGDPLNSDKNL